MTTITLSFFCEKTRQSKVPQNIHAKKISYFKDTRRKKSPKNYTPALTKNTNMDIWVIGTSNELKRF